MDFGDILDKWEGGKAKTGGRAGAGRIGEPAKKALSTWLDKNQVEDKDAALSLRDEAYIRADRIERRRRLLKKRPDASLDLHGKTRDEAAIALETFFEQAHRDGLEKVLIIHGKSTHTQGDPVIEKLCREFFERCQYAGETGFAGSAQGGNGATWVLLKEPRQISE